MWFLPPQIPNGKRITAHPFSFLLQKNSSPPRHSKKKKKKKPNLCTRCVCTSVSHTQYKYLLYVPGCCQGHDSFFCILVFGQSYISNLYIMFRFISHSLWTNSEAIVIATGKSESPLIPCERKHCWARHSSLLYKMRISRTALQWWQPTLWRHRVYFYICHTVPSTKFCRFLKLLAECTLMPE